MIAETGEATNIRKGNHCEKAQSSAIKKRPTTAVPR
jgi:hypothetical protein